MAGSAIHQKLQNLLSDRFTLKDSWREKAAADFIASGLPKISVARGTLTEISGPPSSGRTSLLTGILARATIKPEFCALIDTADSFDPARARASGVQLPFLLWLRCGGSTENALKAADLIVQAGGFGVVAMDLAGVPARDARRISLASWFRLRHAVEKTSAALVVVAEQFNAGSSATSQIAIQRTGFQKSGKLLRGLNVHAAIGPRVRSSSSFELRLSYRD